MQQRQPEYESLLQEIEHMKSENIRLKNLLKANGIAYEPVPAMPAEEKKYSDITFPDAHLGKNERVALFISLFRGREDVFARRWYSKALGKGGYQPVCINEWRRGLCNKKAVKCTECQSRSFMPLNYDVICRHLIGCDENGCDVIGIYAIMSDNNCAFLCTDFDDKSCKHGYKDDVLAFVGLHVSVKSGLSICSVVIDKSIVWYGSINVLGFSTEEDNVIRLQDVYLAAELLGELLEK